VVRVSGEAGLWRIEEREWEEMAVRLALRRVPGGAAVGAAADPGASVGQVDAPHGTTVLRLVDLPPLGEGAASAPAVFAAASGGAGWRRAALLAMSADGEATPIGRTALRAVMGVLDGTLGSGSVTLLDEANAMTVTLIADDMELLPASEAMLAQGRNLCLVGAELMQFALAERVGAATFRLSGLRRGLRGTEWAMGQEAGAPFLLVERDRLSEVAGAEMGATVRVGAIGIGDAEPVEAAMLVRGEAATPPAPAHLRTRADGGGWAFEWVRRSRAGWQWSSGGDVPLAEEVERYRVTVLDGDVPLRTVEVSAPTWTYDAAMIAADGATGSRHVDVRQIGSLGVGRAARVTIAI
jgi:hypothetical protein